VQFFNPFHQGILTLYELIKTMPLTDAAAKEIRNDTTAYAVRMASDLMAVDGDLDEDEILTVIASPAFDSETIESYKTILKMALKSPLVVKDDYMPKILSKAIQLDLANSTRYCSDVIKAFNQMATAVLRADGDYDAIERNYHERLINQWVDNCVSRGVRLYL
jgi:tellurite resistance protein